LSHVNAGPRPSALVGLVVVIALFCAPLFVGLGGLDLRSDEAIYAYAVDRILETSEWLTPRSIQVDSPFLEKPPLKFWMVAAAIRAGILPHDEVGHRFLDALMGAIAFLYIYFLGLRIAGPVCGVVAVLVTFSTSSIVFGHGLRSNNMEAALFLAYCGGVYHFTRWVDGGRPTRQAFAVAAFFVLGFMTKLVAALFLPIVCAATIAVVPIARQRFVARSSDWIAPTATAVAIIAPWFLYQWRLHGQAFWDIILVEHVYTRFTSALDPGHVEPWHFYFTSIITELLYTGSRVPVLAAILFAAASAWRGPWQLRVALVWCLVPLTLMSFGTSKLFHYAYPFLPPIGIATGWAAAEIMRASRRWATWFAGRTARVQLPGWIGHVRYALIGIAILAIAVSSATALTGRIDWRAGGVRILQNSSVARPLLIAAFLLSIASPAAVSVRATTALAIAVLLPVTNYEGRVRELTNIDVRRRALRNCAAQVRASHPSAAAGIYNAASANPNHSDYYYLYRLGPWVEPETATAADVQRRLFDPAQQTLVRMTSHDYEMWRRIAAERSLPLPPAAVLDQIALVTPGPYADCASAANATSAHVP
jgi:4-amino-4-deoxy-L-arabinose transferase-like glycosyltransferase